MTRAEAIELYNWIDNQAALAIATQITAMGLKTYRTSVLIPELQAELNKELLVLHYNRIAPRNPPAHKLRRWVELFASQVTDTTASAKLTTLQTANNWSEAWLLILRSIAAADTALTTLRTNITTFITDKADNATAADFADYLVQMKNAWGRALDNFVALLESR